MKIIICVKQASDTTEIKIDPVKNILIYAGVPSILNPFDRNVVETALRLEDIYDGEAAVLSMGPPQAKVILREALSIGADRAYLVADRVFGDSDTYATGYILSNAIRYLGPFDVVLGGKRVVDGDTDQTTPSIAEHLGMIRLAYIISMGIQGDKVVAKRQVEGGAEVIETELSALYTATKETNKSRYTTIRGKLKFLKAEIPELILEDMEGIIDTAKIGLKGSPTKVKATLTPKRTVDGVYIASGPQSMAASLLDYLEESKVLQKGGRVIGFEQYKDVWVLIECFEGIPKNMRLELLGQGRKLVEGLGRQLCTVVIGKEVENAAQAVGTYGADKIYTVQGDKYDHYSAGGYGYAFLELYKKYDPNTTLVGATVSGGDLGSKLVVSLRTGLTTDYTALSVGDAGNVAWERPTFRGSLYARIFCSEMRPQVGTAGPGTFKEPTSLTESRVRITREKIHADYIRTQVIQFIQACTDGTTPVGEADVIVSDGRGMKNSEDLAILKEPADLLGGMMGCSRAAVDSGWIPQSKQMGQTGFTVTPKLCIACGISGAVQYMAGVSESGTIATINKDASAPIFEVADHCLVGDLSEIVPTLIRELKAKRQA